ncbi:MAG: bifunctional molybdenum cofactor biosynthesis protein MoaC/MoaB [Bacteroidota bacterium]
MRDVSSKYNTLRTAKAIASLTVSSGTLRAIKSGDVPKADPLVVAKVAGIQAAKQTSVLIPYCHQVPLDYVSIDISLGKNSITVTSEVKAVWKTGVEMEALAGVSAAALTLYDMLKIIDDRMEIHSVRLIEKTGGKSNLHKTGKGHSAVVMVLSDSVSNGTKKDGSGKLLTEKLKAFGFKIKKYIVLPDNLAIITNALDDITRSLKPDLILTTGGTGISPRDVTPEATLSVIDRRLDGVEETLRLYGNERTRKAMLSRGIAGVRGNTVIINLPGSKSAVEDGVNALFPSIIHTFDMLKGRGHNHVPTRMKK